MCVGVPIVPDEPTTPDKLICPTESFTICYVGKLPALVILLLNLSQNSQWGILAHPGWLAFLGRWALLHIIFLGKMASDWDETMQ